MDHKTAMEILQLSKDDIEFEPASLSDDFGRVFYFNNEVYRGVLPGREKNLKEILKHAKRWKKYGLIETTQAPITLDEYGVVVHHKKIPHRNYCLEWLPEMFRDAATMFLRLNLRLLKDGFFCKDAHPWNILFRYTEPIFVDIGSIVPYTQVLWRKFLNEFELYFFLPMLFFEQKGAEATYELLKRPIPNAEFRATEMEKFTEKNMFRSLEKERPGAGLKRLLRYISGMDINTSFDSDWSKYNQKWTSIKRKRRFVQKQRAVYEFLQSLPKGNMLDIGCNNGWYSILAENVGYNVVAIDKDVPSISRLYRRAKKGRLNILPLNVDIQRPTESHGVDSSYPAFEDRFKLDVVIAMALVHHLAYSSGMSFDLMANRFSELCSKNLVIEFIPKEDVHVKFWNHEGKEWYRREEFIRTFLKRFDNFHVLKSSPSPREVFLFSR